MPRPDVLDNLSDETTHAAGLAYVAADEAGRPLSVASGYVDLGGLHELATLVGDGRPVRVLLGALPQPGLGAELPSISFAQQLEALAGERDFSRFPPSRAAERLQAVEQWLSCGDVDARRYVARFLHGKAYLFGTVDDPRAAIVTSANLTGAGLSRNLELGIADFNRGPGEAALTWFEGLWDKAEPFLDTLRELLFPAMLLVDPQDVYLRALAELYGDEVADDAAPVESTVMAPFQREGYERARRILERHGGVVYADGVGTGKTEIGLALIEEYALRRQRLALVVCPAQLKKTWQDRIDASRLPARVLSFTELASDEQLNPDAAHPRRHLPVDKDGYGLVVIDEAHALRNEDSTWNRAVDRLLGGERKDAVLLTATPVNNGLWDLYNLVMLFARHDRAFAPIGIPSARRLFVDAGANDRDPENLSPEVLFPLADAVSVRRDRRFIQERWPGATFPDGTPVRFPEPVAATERYDLDAAHPGMFSAITAEIGALEMARYMPSRWLVAEESNAAEARLGGLLQSQILKRFESCWKACLATVERMIAAHDAFLAAWAGGEGSVPSRETLREAAHVEAGETGIAAWVEDALAEDGGARPASDFRPEYGAAVETDRDRLVRIRDRLAELSPDDDPKLALLRRLLDETPATKVAVFATYAETIRYLDEHLGDTRERVTVIGTESHPDDRTAKLARFSPRTVVRPDYVPPEGEVDLLLSTDVLSEGQNLQQAQAVISYDMPWNPQRVVQRNGRVIRLLSPHDEVYVTTMLPAPGELEELLRLEARVQGKIVAAGVYGMEVEVIAGIESELRAYAERLEAGELDELEAEEDETLSGAFLGEQLRALVTRAFHEGELQRVRDLPWGIGAVVRQTAATASRGAPGIFFACRTKPQRTAPEGYRYWRYVELDSEELVATELPILRRIDPSGTETVEPEGVDLEAAWERASADIVARHNERSDPRRAREAIGPAQRFAIELLRDPSVLLPEGADRAEQALSVERSSAVRRELNEIRNAVGEDAITRNRAAELVVDLVDRLGLQPVTLDDLPEPIEADDLGVVCWLAVLPPA